MTDGHELPRVSGDRMRNPDTESIGARIEGLLEEIGASGDAKSSARAQELVRLLMSLYGAGLARMLDVVRTESAGPQAVLARFAQDGLVSSLLVLHELHPHPLETRIGAALTGLEPHLPPGMRLTVVEISETAVRLQAAVAPGSQSGVGHLRAAVERAIQEAAPEIDEVHIDGVGLNDPPLIQIQRRAPAVEAPGAR